MSDASQIIEGDIAIVANSSSGVHGPGSLYVTKYVELTGDGTGGTRTTLKSTQTTARSLNFPDANDTLVGKATTDVLTNKTVIGATNTVEANGLKTTGSAVYVDAAAPPSTGQVLKATSATTATWQTLAAGETITASNVGTGGVGPFKQKTGSNLEFRNTNAASNKITVALDAANNEIDVDAVPDNIMPCMTKGDLIVHNGSTHTCQAVGANDEVLVADSSTGTGVKWKKLTAASLARDLQQAASSSVVTHTMQTFVDMPGMTLTTMNGSTASYIVSFTCNVTVSNANRIIVIIANIDGMDIPGVQLETAAPSAGKFTPITFQYKHPTPLASGKIIKIRWRIEGGDATITAKNRILIIDGS